MAYIRFDVPEIEIKSPKITERSPRFGNFDEWTKAQNASIKKQFCNSLRPYGKTVIDVIQKNILEERKFRLLNQREREEIGEKFQTIKYERCQQDLSVARLAGTVEKG